MDECKSESNIFRAYWRCPFCETNDIDGLVDVCPNCGRHKPENTEYYMILGENGAARSSDRLSKEELERAGISIEECDGEHAEWVCDYCNSLNNWADLYCISCNSPRQNATKEYGMTDIHKINLDLNKSEDPWAKDAEILLSQDTITDTMKYASDCMSSIEDQKIFDYLNSEFDDSITRQKEVGKIPFWKRIKNKINRLSRNTKLAIGVVMLSSLVFGLIGFLFWPIQEIQTVSDFSWDRSIVIEEERTVKENDWSVPSGGRVYDERKEIHHYDQVVDHYEEVSIQKSRKVIDHYDKTYTDNGNGTFTEHKKPVYKTEYYIETEQRPVYRSEPVYRTKYYYEIDRWFRNYTSDSHGNDHDPYWNTNYVLTDNERDLLRYENYYVYYMDDDGDSNQVEVDYDEWNTMDYGDTVIVTTSRIGIDYSVKSIGTE